MVLCFVMLFMGAPVTTWADGDVEVYNVDVWLTEDEDQATVTSLTLAVGDSVDLTAAVFTNGYDDAGVSWGISDANIVTIEAHESDDYRVALTGIVVGTATVTVTSVDDENVTHEIEVEVIDATDITFTARHAVYNPDLWYDGYATSPWGVYCHVIGTVPTDTDLRQIATISIQDSTGYIVKDAVATMFMNLDRDEIDEAAVLLRDYSLLSADALPICLSQSFFDDFKNTLYVITLKTLSGQEFTTSITNIYNRFYENASWTKGSSGGLLIAQLPTLNSDAMGYVMNELSIGHAGQRVLDGYGNADILELDIKTGNVYIKKSVLDDLETGAYSISFNIASKPQFFNFIVVAADSDSEIFTLSANVTISVGGVEKTQKIMVRDINNILSDGTQLHVEVASEIHDELDVPVFDVEHGFHYNIKLLDSSGKELPMPLSAQVELLFECVEGLDIGQLEIVLADSLTDTQFEEDYQTYGDVQYVGVFTNHFSPYSLFDIQTEDEKSALGKGNVKTGDHAVQLTVAGLGSILVLALGIMLRLITSKRKFEE